MQTKESLLNIKSLITTILEKEQINKVLNDPMTKFLTEFYQLIEDHLTLRDEKELLEKELDYLRTLHDRHLM